MVAPGVYTPTQGSNLEANVQACFTRLFTDEHGESRFEDVSVDMQPLFKVEGTKPLFVGPLHPNEGYCFGGNPKGWVGDVRHQAPRRALAVTLRGEVEITTSLGETRRFGPGSVYLVEDTTGAGHSTRVIGDEEVISLAVFLPPNEPQKS
jgi:hypothetical protein